jgi:hypothetical protein
MARLPNAPISDAAIRAAFMMEAPKPRFDNAASVRAAKISPRKPPKATLSAYKPSLGERIESGISDMLGGGSYARHFAGRAIAPLNDVTPVGNMTGAADAGTTFRQGITQGDVAKMALGAGAFGLSVMPMPGQVRQGAKRGLADLLRDEGGAIRAYHGGTAHSGDFNLDHAGSGLGYADEPAVWFTPDKFEANRYAWSVGGGGGPSSYTGKAVYPATIDDAGFDDIPSMKYEPEEFARIIAEARKANKPGIVFRSVREDDRLSSPADQIAVLDPSRIGSYFDK